MLVIGTAGHIDHGKSSIVRRLTGVDPDRLPEEQERGMTIDLGFAFRETPEGQTLAFVDVPGHERFVRTMIAGAGGIDFVMLIVAADDGWMPQTEEHLQIIRLLAIPHGCLVVNKIDLVEPDWLSLLLEELPGKLRGTVLAGQPIFPVSAVSGLGFDVLTAHLEALPTTLSASKDQGKARLPIDRTFVQTGIGVVGTGTLRGGTLKPGESVTVWPSLHSGKIKTLQSQGIDVLQSSPGMRTAVSITGAGKQEFSRGSVVSSIPLLEELAERPVLAIDCELLDSSPIPLEDRRRVSLMIGTSETEAEARMFDRSELAPGERSLVFFRAEQPLCALAGDRCIIRLMTPMVTLGGGVVLDQLPSFFRRRELSRAAYLKERTPFTIESLVLSELSKQLLASRERFLPFSIFSRSELAAAIEGLVDDKQIVLAGELIYRPDVVSTIGDELSRLIAGYLAANPHLSGMSTDLIARALEISPLQAASLATVLVRQGKMQMMNDGLMPDQQRIELKGQIKQAFDQIMNELQSSGTEPPLLPVLAARGKIHQQAIRYMLEAGLVHKCGAELLLPAPQWEQIVGWIRSHLAHEPQLTVQAIRTKFGYTRKYVIPILEETDRIGLTARNGDVRVKGVKYGTQATAS